MDVLIGGLAVIGLLISTYFTAVAYHWIRPDAGWIPSVCRMGERTCASIVFTPRARVLGPPNSLLGQIYYVGLLAGLTLGWMDGWLQPAYLAASLLTVALAVYLSYSLIFVTRVPCPLCFMSHGINVTLCALLWLRI